MQEDAPCLPNMVYTGGPLHGPHPTRCFYLLMLAVAKCSQKILMKSCRQNIFMNFTSVCQFHVEVLHMVKIQCRCEVEDI